MARQRILTSRGEYVESRTKVFAQLIWTENGYARRSKLDRKWNAVQPPANLGDSDSVFGRQAEALVDGERTLDKERYRGKPHCIACLQFL